MLVFVRIRRVGDRGVLRQLTDSDGRLQRSVAYGLVQELIKLQWDRGKA